MQTRFPVRTGAAAAALLTAVLLAGCHDDTPPSATVVNTPPASTTTVVPGTSASPSTTTATIPDTKVNTNAGPGGSTGTDSALADQINTAIVHNKQMTGSRVEVVATAGVVTLNGQVQNQQQKALAQSTANQVPGVSSIKNKLIIVSTGGTKPKPIVVTKTKTVVVHDAAPAAPAAAPNASQAPASADQTAPAPTDQTTPPASTGTTGQ